jgi:hypothetical protein
MTSNDFYDWKRHPITDAVFKMLQERVAYMTEHLQLHAGDDPLKDKQYSGAIMAHNDILSISYQDLDIEEPQE